MDSSKISVIIFSSGLGTRLYPLTKDTPKTVLPIKGKLTLLDMNIRIFKNIGVKKFIITLSYGRELIEEVVKKYNDLDFILVDEGAPVGHGKSILDNIHLFSEDIMLVGLNGDTYLELDLHKYLVQYWKKNTVFSTSSTTKDSNLLVDSAGYLVGVNLIGKDFYYSHVDSAGAMARFDSLGFYTFKVEDLKKISPQTQDFIGLFGRNDLFNLMVDNSLLSEVVTDFPFTKFFSMNTLEDYSLLRDSL